MNPFQLEELEESIEQLIDKIPDRKKHQEQGKHRARNAIRHIRKAWAIADIDLEMAIFRAITGEEESASAIFSALKLRKYDGADKINPTNHKHKNAVFPFLRAVGQFFERIDFEKKLKPALIYDKSKGLKFTIRVIVAAYGELTASE